MSTTFKKAGTLLKKKTNGKDYLDYKNIKTKYSISNKISKIKKCSVMKSQGRYFLIHHYFFKIKKLVELN